MVPIPLPSHGQWFNEARFGLFIHWGAYSAGGRGEWMANRERIPYDEYREKYVSQFTAEHYHPEEWARLAVEAGMKYAVLTTRHHDGFALWPTATSEFHAGNYGPKRDLLRPFVEAFRAAGLKIGFYYSPASWYHPDYPGPFFRDWPSNDDWKSEEARLRFIEFYRAQLRELLTQYGKIDYLWYDGAIPNNLQCREANEEAIRLQPHLLINERNGLPFHVLNCEQAIKAPTEDYPWEACMTLNGSWGYYPGDQAWKQPRDVLELLLRTAEGGGNLLLNVGPRADGTIPEESVKILREVGAWLRCNGEAVYSSERSPFTWQNWGRITVKENRIFLNIWNYTGADFTVADIANKVTQAKLLKTGEPLPFRQEGDRLFLTLPDAPIDPLVTTVEVIVEGKAETTAKQTSFWIPG